MSKQAISPFTGIRIQNTVQGFLWHRLRVDYMGYAFNAFKSVMRKYLIKQGHKAFQSKFEKDSRVVKLKLIGESKLIM